MCTGSLRAERNPVAGPMLACEKCDWTGFSTHVVTAIVVVEHDGGIVLVHPPGVPAGAPASLPGGLLEYGETPEGGAVRVARELTGLQVELVSELIRFQQLGTPFGPALMFGFAARSTGGALSASGHEGPAVAYAIDNLPAIVPIRAANQRVLAAYLDRLSHPSPAR